MNRFMVDIETLDTAPTAVVLSLAIVEIGNPDRWLHLFPSVTEQLDMRRTISWDTLKYWARAADDARLPLFSDDPRSSAFNVSHSIRNFLPAVVDEVWANGPSFDLVILDSYLAAYQPHWWNFRQYRDVRTLAAMYPDIDRTKPSIAHNALSDALAQADWVARMLGGV